MANIIDNLETEAQSFMAKRKKIEEKRKAEMLAIIALMFKEVFNIIKSSGNISISFVPTYVISEIKPVIDKYRQQNHSYLDSFIRDDFDIGITTGHKYLTMARENIPPKNNEIRDSEYEEVLLALLLYGQTIIDGIHDDLITNIIKDMTSIYISQNRNNQAEKNIDTNNSTINTVLAGSIISRYINPTFQNINNRTNMTAQNESNRALNHGLLMTYLLMKRNHLPELAVKWVEVRDERLCKHCRDAAHGGEYGNGVYNIMDVQPPPLHSRCRCILIPFSPRWEGME